MSFSPFIWGFLAVLLVWGDLDVQAEWIFFQNHLHSSDKHTYSRFPEYTSYQDSYSKEGIQYLIELAQKRGIQSLAFTEHNTISHWFDPLFTQEKRIILVPAMEFTQMFSGHATLLGFNAAHETEAIMPPRPRGSLDVYDYRKMIEQVHSRGGLVVVNHPKSSYFPHRWPSNSYGADGIELNFSSFMNPQETINWWENFLREGKKIFLVGGSDYHVGNIYGGDPFESTNLIWVEEKSPKGVLKALSNGNLEVLRSVFSPKIFVSVKKEKDGNFFQMGETVLLPSLQKLFIQIEVVGGKGTVIHIYNRKGMIKALDIDKHYSYFQMEYDPIFSIDFIRLDVYNKKSQLETVTNPIYIKSS